MNYLLDALAWIADPARWPGPDGIATRLGEHLAYSAVGVLIACAIGIPAGWLVGQGVMEAPPAVLLGEMLGLMRRRVVDIAAAADTLERQLVASGIAPPA